MKEEEIIIEDKRKNPIFYIIALFIILLMVISFFPYYSVRSDPHPKKIPDIEDIVPDIKVENISIVYNKYNYNAFLLPNEPLVKQSATRIATFGCDSNKLCQAKAEYYFVRDNFIYVSEYDEYIQSPVEMLLTHGGDCDDHAVLLANLLSAIGLPTRFVFVPRHVFIQVYIKDSPRKYTKDGWIFLDPTCKSCEFGEIPREYQDIEYKYS